MAKDGDARPRKKAKLETYAAHAFPPTNADDEVSYKRKFDLLKAEVDKPGKPRTDVLKELMVATFANRFDLFVNHRDPGTLAEYLQTFPILRKATYVSHCFILFMWKVIMLINCMTEQLFIQLIPAYFTM